MMVNKKIACIVCVLITISCILDVLGQPGYIYEGGSGGGYSTNEDTISTLYQYQGGIGIGYGTLANSVMNQYSFSGGFGIGYCSEFSLIPTLYWYEGGQSDGFSSKEKSISDAPLFSGGANSGFIMKAMNDSQPVLIFEGGSDDGYFQFEKCEDFIWTGAVGSGWLVTGNWNHNMVPTLKRNVIIPAGVPAYPSLNAGVFAIGDNPNAGIYECRQLWIQDGAWLETKINNLVENYGTIKIDGTMQVKNSAIDAFQNNGNGVILVTSTGVLMFKP